MSDRLIPPIDERALGAFLPRQRWFGGKARRLASTCVVDQALLADRAWLSVVEVSYEDGGREAYLVPLAIGSPADTARLEREYPQVIVHRVENGEAVFDGLYQDGCCFALLTLAQGGGELPTGHGHFMGIPVSDGELSSPARIRRTAPDQSNTSVIFDDTLVMKMFRRLEAGVNPDVELCTYLTRRGFPHVPATIATVDYTSGVAPPASVLMVQQSVPNRGNAWQIVLATLDEYLRDSSVSAEASAGLAGLLGKRTGQLHQHLASATDPDLAPERFTAEELDLTANQMRDRARAQFELLQAAVQSLSEPVRSRALRVLSARDGILAGFDELRHLTGQPTRIRCHGDYHLGQVLVTGDDVAILDFEGEPARSLAERRARSSPLRDVAGMLRSFSYASVAALRALPDVDPAVRPSLERRLETWEDAARRQFVQAYREVAQGSAVLSATEADFNALLRAFTADKAAYELGYELNNRPDWLDIPLVGLERLAPRTPNHDTIARSR